MNTRQLEYVIAVAEEGSFSKAAKRLIISQPSLSQYVQKLEQSLGAELFVRTTPLKLTLEGRAYVESARRILKEEEKMCRMIADITDDKVGEITIAAGQYNNACLLPHIVKEFQEKYPYIKVIMKEAVEPQLLDILDRGECSIVLTTMDVENELEMYEVVNLVNEKYLIAVPDAIDPGRAEYNRKMSDCRDGEFPPIDIMDLKELPFIFIGNKHIALHTMLEGLCRKAGIEPKTQIDCANISVVMQLLANGAGISVVPSSAARFDVSGKTNFYSSTEIKKSRNLNLVYSKEHYRAKSVNYFIEMLKNMNWD